MALPSCAWLSPVSPTLLNMSERPDFVIDPLEKSGTLYDVLYHGMYTEMCSTWVGRVINAIGQVTNSRFILRARNPPRPKITIQSALLRPHQKAFVLVLFLLDRSSSNIHSTPRSPRRASILHVHNARLACESATTRAQTDVIVPADCDPKSATTNASNNTLHPRRWRWR